MRGENIACTVATPNTNQETLSSFMGNVNYHVELLFNDGICWIARLKRQNASTPPAAVRDYMIRSEASTYGFLARTNVPAPRVFEVMVGSDNPVGSGYILMEKVAGIPLSETSPTSEQMRKVLTQLADVYVELKKYPFSVIGSLDQFGENHIGPLASELLADLHEAGPSFLGRFKTAADYYKGMVTRILDLISTGELYPLWSVDTFLIHRFLLDLVPILAEADDHNGQFFLRHPDSKGDQILVDADFNINGIIDWEWAYTAPRFEAFTSPMALWDVSAFFDGDNELSEHERLFSELLDAASASRGEVGGGDSLGRYVRDGRRWQRFCFCAGYELYDWDWENYVGLFGGLRKAFGVDADLRWEEWRAKALERYRDDVQLKSLLAA